MDTFLQMFNWSMAASLIFLFISILVWRYISLLKLNKELKANIAEREEIDTILRDNALRFRQLFENTIGISVQGYNDKRQIIYWNDASKFLYGYNAEQAMGKQLEDLIIPDEMREHVITGINAWIDGGPPIPSAELSLKKSDGSRVSVFSNHFLLRNSRNQVELYCVDIDLTDLKKIEKQKQKLLQSKQYAEAANQAKSEFLANISHELRTPMHGILSFAHLGIDMIDKSTSEKNLIYFNNIKTSGDRLLALLNDLLDLAKLESGKMDIDYRLASLLSVAKSCVTEQQARLNELNQKIIYISGDYIGKGHFDDVKIGQVITNFLSNAIKFAPENSNINFTIEPAKIENTENRKLSALLFSIRDYGNGIPEDEHKMIFDKFIQSSDTTIATTKSTGLGLPICKEIIELHQGKVWAENHPDGGAVFSFIIPVE